MPYAMPHPQEKTILRHVPHQASEELPERRGALRALDGASSLRGPAPTAKCQQEQSANAERRERQAPLWIRTPILSLERHCWPNCVSAQVELASHRLNATLLLLPPLPPSDPWGEREGLFQGACRHPYAPCIIPPLEHCCLHLDPWSPRRVCHETDAAESVPLKQRDVLADLRRIGAFADLDETALRAVGHDRRVEEVLRPPGIRVRSGQALQIATLRYACLNEATARASQCTNPQQAGA